MNNPLTREEYGDMLLILHSALRKAVARHQASRLELFFRLQFPDLDSAIESEERLLQGMDILSPLKKVVTEAVSEHPLFREINARQSDLLKRIHPVFFNCGCRKNGFDFIQQPDQCNAAF